MPKMIDLTGQRYGNYEVNYKNLSRNLNKGYSLQEAVKREKQEIEVIDIAQQQETLFNKFSEE